MKDKTEQKLDASMYEGDLSLVGEFVRNVLEKENWSAEWKSKVVQLGLKALSHREVDG